MIEINGTKIPTPSDYKVGVMDLSKAERNVAGTMVIDRIATKRKLDLSWNFLSKEDVGRLFRAVSPVFFTVRYTDPLDNTRKTGSFYAGDRNAGALDYQQGKIRYKDITVNLIER